ncbi:MAG: hypothetical protein AAFU58_00470, partial [Pseudomonadota bacterium]
QANIGFDRTPVSFREYLGLQLKAREFSALYLLDGNRTVIARLVADDQGEATFGLPEKLVFDQLDGRAAARRAITVRLSSRRYSAENSRAFN